MMILSKNLPFATVTSGLNPPLQATVSFDAIFCFILFYFFGGGSGGVMPL